MLIIDVPALLAVAEGEAESIFEEHAAGECVALSAFGRSCHADAREGRVVPRADETRSAGERAVERGCRRLGGVRQRDERIAIEIAAALDGGLARLLGVTVLDVHALRGLPWAGGGSSSGTRASWPDGIHAGRVSRIRHDATAVVGQDALFQRFNLPRLW